MLEFAAAAGVSPAIDLQLSELRKMAIHSWDKTASIVAVIEAGNGVKGASAIRSNPYRRQQLNEASGNFQAGLTSLKGRLPKWQTPG